MKKFFREIKSSIYGPSLYKNIVSGGESFGASIKYLLKLLAVVAIVFWVFMITVGGTSLYFGVKKLGPELIKQYPAGLELSVKGGEVSINQPSPYKIAMPKGDDSVDASGKEDNLFVVDTASEPTYDRFNSYKTLVLVGKNTVWYKDENGQVKILPLTKVPNVTINQALINEWYPKVEAFLQGAFVVLLLVIWPLMFIAMSVYYLAYLLVAALLVFLLMKLMKVPATYGKAYQVAAHAVTVTIVVGALTFFIPFISFPFLETIILLVVVGVNLKR